ncbi:AAA family ATPase [Saccharibacter sp. 17.LH.SD]|uniref:AAA family ATPase n=1 Tax=Saccharibacter sp. 17.LH.SD TaxID=2689393 RepID=UPI00136A0FDC|nr:AAA family ATPase [Saccharibacter sp. 17.LH.SD]MXV43935.1 AAA family ATPase [Saccharibacter sp. 17.LH.SD]
MVDTHKISVDTSKELVERVRQAMEEDRISQRVAGEQIGIPSSTLSLWLSGTYKGILEKVEAKISKWLDARTIRERTLASSMRVPSWVETPAYTTFELVFTHSQFTPDIGLITGGAGVGKTFAANTYANRGVNVWVVTADPSMKTPLKALKEIAFVLGDVSRNDGSWLRAIVRRVKGSQGLLIIDEAQHLSTDAIDQIRAIHDQAEIGVVFSGNEPLRGRIEGIGRLDTHAQLFSRIGIRKDRKKCSRGDVEALLNAWQLENQNLRLLVTAIASQQGALRTMNKVLRYAVQLCRADHRDELSLDDVQSAWKELTMKPVPSFKKEA